MKGFKSSWSLSDTVKQKGSLILTCVGDDFILPMCLTNYHD